MGSKKLSFTDALLARRKAKNAFLEIAHNKDSSKKMILQSYKEYRKADDKLVKVYESKEGLADDRSVAS